MASALVFTFTILQILAYGLVAIKLIRSGLSGTYRYLTGLMLFECARVATAGFLRRGSDLYGYFYVFSQPVLWLLYALVTLEVFHVVLRAHPGIAAFSRRSVTVAVVLAALLSASTLALFRKPDSPYWLLESFFTIERVVLCSLLFFVVLLILALAWFPVPLTRNALVHAGVFTFFFGTSTAALLVRTLVGPQAAGMASIALIAATLISLVLWGVLLTPEGEQRKVKAGYRRSPDDEDRVLAQLDAINRTLLGSARK